MSTKAYKICPGNLSDEELSKITSDYKWDVFKLEEFLKKGPCDHALRKRIETVIFLMKVKLSILDQEKGNRHTKEMMDLLEKYERLCEVPKA